MRWSVRWAGTYLGPDGNQYWDLDEDALALWDSDI
jgi:hypothetical protein